MVFLERIRLISLALFLLAATGETFVSSLIAKPRARDWGIPFEGAPGKFNAITDIEGVEVGQATIIRGDGERVAGSGPARTGVTALFPLGKTATLGVVAGWATLNGNGEMTGAHYVEEFGELHGPVLLTNTLSVGTVHQAAIEWSRDNVADRNALYGRALPLVAETWDGFLNDIYGLHVKKEHVFQALDSAKGGPVAEGNVGGGTGMRTFEFKSGIGTASRVVSIDQGRFSLGVLVQSNFGRRHQLRVAGIPVGIHIQDLMPESGASPQPDGNSIIAIIATDAPLIPIQLKRIAKRATLALGRLGSIGMEGSGDFFLAFSTANRIKPGDDGIRELDSLGSLNPFFEAAVQAVEEAILNSLIAAATMRGADGNTVHAIPRDRLQAILRDNNRLAE